MTKTFKERGREPGLIDRDVRCKLEPELVGAAFDVVWFVAAAEAAEQRAACRASVPHFHIVVGAAVVSLELRPTSTFGKETLRNPGVGYRANK